MIDRRDLFVGAGAFGVAAALGPRRGATAAS